MGLLGPALVGVIWAAPCPPAGLSGVRGQPQGLAWVEAVEALGRASACPCPDEAADLGRIFIESRHGSMGEDPDLFEAALDALRQLPPDDSRRAVERGMGPALLDAVWADLHRRWLRPASAGSPALAAAWAALDPRDLAGVRSAAAAALLESHNHDRDAFLGALSAHGGSLSHGAVLPLQDALLAALVGPDTGGVVAQVALDAGIDGPALRAALGALPDAAQRSTPVAARLAGAPPPAAPLRAPALAPGLVPGQEARPPAAPPSIDLPAPSPLRQPLPLQALVGVGLAGTGAALGLRAARPRAGAVALGLGLVVAGDAALAPHAPPAAAPLFRFLPAQELDPRPLPGRDDLWIGGPSLRVQRVRAPRPAGLRRVLVLGASSVHGSHFRAATAFPAKLEAGLRARRGAADVEVLNLGLGGATSATLAAIADGPLFDARAGGPPDAVVIYAGHNDGAQIARLGRYQGPSPRALRARLWLARRPTYRLIEAALARGADPGSARTALYTEGIPSRADVTALIGLAEAHLRHHIGHVLDRSIAAGARPLLVLPATNLRHAHLEPFPDPGPGDAQDLDRLRALAEAEARAGRPAAARAALQAAIDRSASPRELLSPLRAALIDEAHDRGVDVVDAQALFSAWAPDGVSPSGLFWDDLHPSAAGHAVLAEALAPRVDALLPPAGAP